MFIQSVYFRHEYIANKEEPHKGQEGLLPNVQMEGTLVIQNDRINTDTDTEYLVQLGYAFFDPTSSMLIIDTGLRIVTA